MCESCSMYHSSSQEYGPPSVCAECGAPPPGQYTSNEPMGLGMYLILCFLAFLFLGIPVILAL